MLSVSCVLRRYLLTELPRRRLERRADAPAAPGCFDAAGIAGCASGGRMWLTARFTVLVAVTGCYSKRSPPDWTSKGPPGRSRWHRTTGRSKRGKRASRAWPCSHSVRTGAAECRDPAKRLPRRAIIPRTDASVERKSAVFGGSETTAIRWCRRA
jgi:hypothetical protein